VKKRTVLVIAAVAAAGALTAGAVRLTGNGGGLPAVGQVIPPGQRLPGPGISGPGLTGQHLDLARWRGSVVVVNFWGAWCVPCRAEAPALARVARDTRVLGVRFAGIDVREGPAAGLAFDQAFRIPYPSISDPDDLIGARFGAAAPAATPSTYILDSRGRIAWAWFGSTSYSQLELAVVQVAGGS
jgi:thiol-disulfide isomerase/thioredoxin